MTKPKEWEVYLYGTISVLIVSGMSFIGASTIPFMRKKGFNMVMIFFMALAVGTMAADALLHLVPQMLGLHSHGDEPEAATKNAMLEGNWSDSLPFATSATGTPAASKVDIAHTSHSHNDDDAHSHGKRDEHSHSDGHNHSHDRRRRRRRSTDHDHDDHNGHSHEAHHNSKGEHDGEHKDSHHHDHLEGFDYFGMNMKLLVALVSVYGLYLFESVSKLYTLRIRRKLKSKDKIQPEAIPAVSYSNGGQRPANFTANGFTNGLVASDPMATVIQLENGTVQRNEDGTIRVGPIPRVDSTDTIYATETMKMEDGREYQVFTAHKHSVLPDVGVVGNLVGDDKLICGMKPVVFMIIFGGALHNFADGLALGASYAADKLLGLSTTIALVCHEIPHELGDFAVLLNTGLSVKKALFLNGMSAVPAIIGLYVAIGLSLVEGVLPWIFAVVLGTFIYISLVAILNEIREVEPERTYRGFFLSHGGLIIGALILVLIALYEKDIHL